jgi:hypothetical protein
MFARYPDEHVVLAQITERTSRERETRDDTG